MSDIYISAAFEYDKKNDRLIYEKRKVKELTLNFTGEEGEMLWIEVIDEKGSITIVGKADFTTGALNWTGNGTLTFITGNDK